MRTQIELAEKIEDVSGEWVKHRGFGIEILIRPVPPPEMRRIQKRHLGKERKITLTKEGRETRVDQDKGEAFLLERACLAMQDTRPLRIAERTSSEAPPEPREEDGFRIKGAALAERFSEVLGEKVSEGDLVKLHGRWTYQAKSLVLGLAQGLKDFVLEHAGRLEGDDVEGEEGKDES